MQITEVRIKLMDDASDRLCAFCSITLDECFVIRDLKIIQGTKGAFVAMPSRKLTDRCPKCHYKNHLRSAYCNQCGIKLHPERALKDDDGRAKLYADIAHPINSECRDQIQQMVIAAYEEELVKSKQEGYICTYDDFEEDRFASLNAEQEENTSFADDATNKSGSVNPDLHKPSSAITEAAPAEGPEPVESLEDLDGDDGKKLRVDHPKPDRPLAGDHNAGREATTDRQPERHAVSGGDGFGDGII